MKPGDQGSSVAGPDQTKKAALRPLRGSDRLLLSSNWVMG
jgi:hypothetical protein